MIAITRCYHFAASHRLHLDHLNEQQNEDLYGKCNNPYGHGHNYRLEVGVTGWVHEATGQLLPLGCLDQLVQEQILNRFDHRDMNLDIPEFASLPSTLQAPLVPTTENVLAVIAGLLSQHWEAYIPGPARLYRLHIQETDRNGFETFFPLKPSPNRGLSQ